MFERGHSRSLFAWRKSGTCSTAASNNGHRRPPNSNSWLQTARSRHDGGLGRRGQVDTCVAREGLFTPAQQAAMPPPAQFPAAAAATSTNSKSRETGGPRQYRQTFCWRPVNWCRPPQCPRRLRRLLNPSFTFQLPHLEFSRQVFSPKVGQEEKKIFAGVAID